MTGWHTILKKKPDLNLFIPSASGTNKLEVSVSSIDNEV